MRNEIKQELTQHIIPFWQGLIDEENGGFIGCVNFYLQKELTAEKGSILHSRILWFFSKAYTQLNDKDLLKNATHAYNFLVNCCEDEKEGGVYWSVTAQGEPYDTTKHTYAQAFAIYGLAAYYAASKNKLALEKAYALFDLIESKCRDDGGYGEAFDAGWQKTDNGKLSENGVEAQRTMNTLLHIFEAYAELYSVTSDARVGEKMRYILELFLSKVYNPKLHRQEVFFDKDYRSLIDIHSFGHDIEAAWLLDWGCGLLLDKELYGQVLSVTNSLADNVWRTAYGNHSLHNECENGIVDKNQVWWVQAEAVTGFVNAWQKTGDVRYLSAAKDIWQNIRDNMVDKRPGGEWFWLLAEDGSPIKDRPIVEPWKCPYHNGRMCLEMLRRLPDNV